MSCKVVFIGAGSIGFTRKLVRDLLMVEEFDGMDIVLMDINEENLNMVYTLCRRDIESNGKKARLTRTTDRREAVENADYIINTVRIGGLEAFESDIELPLRYGIDQCVGDTLGAGGIMYGQRGIHAVLEFCRDIREAARPDVLMLNYANPNAMLTWAANTYGGVHTIGLCHGVPHGHALLARALGVPAEELDYSCVGINHQTWYTQLRYRGEDMTGKVLDALLRDETIRKTEKVRIDMLKRFGYFSTESNGHLSEYLPWYRKRPEELPDWIGHDAWVHGETGGYLRVCREGRLLFEEDFKTMDQDPPWTYAPEHRSQEHGSYIIEGRETGRIYRGHFNVINHDAISNLPSDCVVEVPGYVDRTGVHIPQTGDLPDGCAAVCLNSINVQRLAVKAAVTGDDQLLKQAMLLDPLNGAVLNPPEIWQMTDDLLIAQEQWLPQYGGAIQAAKKRGADGPRLPVREYRGAARKPVRDVAELLRVRRDTTPADEGAQVN